MKTMQTILVALLFGITISSNAEAHDSIGFSLNIGQPYYYAPAPIYYEPPPVVYYQPRAVYREYYSSGEGTYYYPRPYRDNENDDWRNRHEYRSHHGQHKHHGHDDED